MKEYEKFAMEHVTASEAFPVNFNYLSSTDAYKAGFLKCWTMAVELTNNPNITQQTTDDEIRNLGQKEV